MPSDGDQISGSSENLVIIGAGGHGSEIRAYIENSAVANGHMRFLGFIDDNRAKGPWLGTEILGGMTDLEVLARREKGSEFHYITACGDNPVRRRLVKNIEAFGLTNVHPRTLRHPTSQVGREVEVGPGTLLAPNVIVTTRVHIGSHCILNVRASVSHDCVIGDFVNINPGAVICGTVDIGIGAYIGAGAVLKEGIRIGRGVTVGAGAVVIRDLPNGVTAVGVPARVIKENSIDWINA